MRIGFDAKRAFNNHTGLGNYARFVIQGMLAHYPEHEYVLFTPSINPAFKELFTQHPNVTIVTPQSWWGKRFKSLWRTHGIGRLCSELKLDVYHGLSNELPAGMDSFSGKKLVTIHDLIFLRYPQYYKLIDRFIYKRKFKTACQAADVVLAASQQTATDIETFFQVSRDKVRIGYQNCAPHFHQNQSKSELEEVRERYGLPADYMVCIGTIEERKRQLMLLKAYHQLNTDAHLVFVGRRTAYAAQLDAYIATNGLQQKVRFIEGASFNDFPAFYRLSKLAVYVSEFEGFGIPVLEALRCGTTVVAAQTSSLTEVGGDAVYYVKGNDPGEWAQVLNDAILQPIPPSLIQAQVAKFDTPTLMLELYAAYTGKSS